MTINRRSILSLGLMLVSSVSLAASPDAAKTGAAAKNSVVVMETTKGPVRIELYSDKAPITVKNFLQYVNAKHYDGLIFHRVIPGFMVQGGGMYADMYEKPTRDPIKNEAANGLKNERGTLAMARTGVVDSATSQFFINVKDNAFLDHRDRTPMGYGYAVFGKVIDGMDVVDQLVGVPTTTKGPFQNVPSEPLVIRSVRLLEPAKEPVKR